VLWRLPDLVHAARVVRDGHAGAVLCLLEATGAPPDATDGGGGGDISQRRSYLLSGGADGVVRAWDPTTGVEAAQWSHHTGAVERLLLLRGGHGGGGSCGEMVLTIGADCCVGLLSMDSMRLERMFPAHPAPVRQVRAPSLPPSLSSSSGLALTFKG
jgi:WD40 repeat protein